MTDRNRDPHPDSPPDADHDRRSDMQQVGEKSASDDNGDEPPVFVEHPDGDGVGATGGRVDQREDGD